MSKMMMIDGLQYSHWSRKVFEQMRDGGLSAVHVTIAYHEVCRETLYNIGHWNRMFEMHSDMIVPVHTAADIEAAHAQNKVGIIFGFQNCSPIEDDIDLVAIFNQLGVKIMQLTYNNQSLLATGCYEDEDTGITRMGRQVIKEMNRVGMVVDMSHSAERSTLEAIEISQRPIAITHANPYFWHPAKRNKSNDVLRALGQSGGMLGFSLYPHHLKDKSDCRLTSFCQMIADTADLMGIDNIGIGSDLCQDQPDSVVEWMRVGRWTKEIDYGEGSASNAGFPPMPSWFIDNRHFGAIADGLRQQGFSEKDTHAIMGENWLRFYDENFGAETA